MSIFPDWIYKFTPRDEQVTPLEMVNIKIGTQDALDTLDIANVYTVPAGRVFLLSSVSMETRADGIFGTKDFYLQGGNSGSDATIASKSFDTPILDSETRETFPLCLALPSGTVLEARANFTGVALADNTFTVSLTGVLIPRGNFAF